MNGNSNIPTKRARVIRLLLERRTANRFEIEALARDHVPNSTIAELRAAGLEITSRIVEVPGYGGQVARIAEYTLPDHARSRAREMIEGAR